MRYERIDLAPVNGRRSLRIIAPTDWVRGGRCVVILGHRRRAEGVAKLHREGSGLSGRSPTLAEGAAEVVTLRQSPRS